MLEFGELIQMILENSEDEAIPAGKSRYETLLESINNFGTTRAVYEQFSVDDIFLMKNFTITRNADRTKLQEAARYQGILLQKLHLVPSIPSTVRFI